MQHAINLKLDASAIPGSLAHVISSFGKTLPCIPIVEADGVLEICSILDFHAVTTDDTDASS